MKMNDRISNEDARTVICSALRPYVGRAREWSWSDLAEAAGEKEGTLRSYVAEGGPLMPLDVFMRVSMILPPQFFARVARVLGFTSAPADVDDTATIRRITAKSARLVADASDYMEDNIITPREHANLADRARELLPDLQALANSGRAH